MIYYVIILVTTLLIYAYRVKLNTIYRSLRNHLMTMIRNRLGPIFFAMFCIVTFAQYFTQVFDVPNGKVNISVTILTFYVLYFGIIQFLLNFALVDTRDKVWGRSVTSDKLSNMISHKFIGIRFFRFLTVTIFAIPAIGYKRFFLSTGVRLLESVWIGAVGVLGINFLVLFFNSITILRYYQKSLDSSNYLQSLSRKQFKYNLISDQIDYIISELSSNEKSIELQNSSYGYYRYLHSFLSEIDQTEISAVLSYVENGVRYYILNETKKYRKCKSNYLYTLFCRFNKRATDKKEIINIYNNLFELMKLYTISCDVVIAYLKYRDEILSELYNIEFKRNPILISKSFLNFKESKKFNARKRNSNYLNLPSTLWSSIKSYDDAIDVLLYLKHESLMQQVEFELNLEMNYEKVDIEYYEYACEQILSSKKLYLVKLLESMEKSYAIGEYRKNKQSRSNDLLVYLSDNSYSENNTKLVDWKQNEVCSYIVESLKASPNNEFLEELFHLIEYPYFMAIWC